MLLSALLLLYCHCDTDEAAAASTLPTAKLPTAKLPGRERGPRNGAAGTRVVTAAAAAAATALSARRTGFDGALVKARGPALQYSLQLAHPEGERARASAGRRVAAVRANFASSGLTDLVLASARHRDAVSRASKAASIWIPQSYKEGKVLRFHQMIRRSLSFQSFYKHLFVFTFPLKRTKEPIISIYLKQ